MRGRLQVYLRTFSLPELMPKGGVLSFFLCGSGFTRDLLLSEYKATQLGLQRDGHVVIAAAAGGSILMLRRSVSSMLIGCAVCSLSSACLLSDFLQVRRRRRRSLCP